MDDLREVVLEHEGDSLAVDADAVLACDGVVPVNNLSEGLRTFPRGSVPAVLGALPLGVPASLAAGAV